MSRLSYNELKIGTIFIKDGEPWKVLEYAFIRMQQRKPVTQLKIENLSPARWWIIPPTKTRNSRKPR